MTFYKSPVYPKAPASNKQTRIFQPFKLPLNAKPLA